VLGSLPLYIAISAASTPLFRRRLDEKFRRGAENQAFLVECVAGAETLKAMAVEPQMQRRWEEQLAGYVASSFRVLALGNVASQTVQFVNKIAMAGILYFGAKLVIEGELTVGELVAFNLLAGRVNQPVLRLAQIWQDFHQARLSVERLGDILNTPREGGANTGRVGVPRFPLRLGQPRVRGVRDLVQVVPSRVLRIRVRVPVFGHLAGFISSCIADRHKGRHPPPFRPARFRGSL